LERKVLAYFLLEEPLAGGDIGRFGEGRILTELSFSTFY
jgi:hypothetical protein